MIALDFLRDLDGEMVEEQKAEERRQNLRHTDDDMRAAILRSRELAHEEGFAEGKAAGIAETEAALMARQTATLEALAERMGALVRQDAQHRATLERQLMDFVLTICETVFPEFLARRSRARAEAQIRQAIRYALGAPTIRVELAPEAARALAPGLRRAAGQAGAGERLEIVADDALAEGEARVDWQNGFLEYSFPAICERILKELKRKRADFDERTDHGE